MKVILLESDIKKNMIIECINCNKKFNVDSELIPSEGRKIQCGLCNHTWHFIIEDTSAKTLILDNTEISQETKKEAKLDAKDIDYLAENIQLKSLKQETDIKNDKETESKVVSNFFSYLLVIIISFFALLILIDTLKTPLINIFPQFEIVLFNFFEILKDVKLFIIDLT